MSQHFVASSDQRTVDMNELDDLLARIREPIIHWKVTPQTYSELFSKLLLDSRQRGASHIHLHCTSRDLLVRYRVDGRLQLRAILPNEATTGLIDEIRTRAHLDCGEWRRPQDGQIYVSDVETPYIIRVSTIPSPLGPTAVLAYEHPEPEVCRQLHELGLLPDQELQIAQMLQRRRGLIMICGFHPHTAERTLGHAMLMAAQKMGKEVLSLEWGVRQRLPGILQVDFDAEPKLSQSEWIQASLRTRPDVLFIELDRNTDASFDDIIVAARNHCLVIASIVHSPFVSFFFCLELLYAASRRAPADALIGAIELRDLPKVCSKCVTTYVPSASELRELRIRTAKPKELLFIRGKGCRLCAGSGRHGKTGVYEVAPITQELRDQFPFRREMDEIRQKLRDRGMTTMYQSAIHKVVTRQISSVIAYSYCVYWKEHDTWTDVDPQTGLIQGTP